MKLTELEIFRFYPIGEEDDLKDMITNVHIDLSGVVEVWPVVESDDHCNIHLSYASSCSYQYVNLSVPAMLALINDL